MFLLAVCLSVPAQRGKTSARKTTTVQKNTAGKKKTTARKQTSTTQKNKNGKQGSARQPSISSLKAQKAQIAKERSANIKRKEELERNVKRGVENLMMLDTEIARQRKVIDTIRTDITHLSNHIAELDSQLVVLEKELADRRNRYMRSMRYMHRNRSVQNQMMFVFSADNFNQMYRRLRFNREYAAYQKAQGQAVISKQEQVEQKKAELTESKHQKDVLLNRGEQEQRSLEGKQNEQKTQVAQLQKKQKTVQALIEQQQRQEAELNARIDKLIAEEIAREKARLEAEARRKAAAEAARKEQERKRAANEAARRESRRRNNATRKSGSEEVAETPSKAKEEYREEYRMPDPDRVLSGNFESNRGRLPVPITGAYRIIRGFGPYTPEGLSQVRLVSNGWHLKGQPGAKAQSIFNGEVSGVYYQGGGYIVTVRHGRYISAYINLASVSVQKGQKVSTRQVVGSLKGDNTMQFQLRHWNNLLNPALWLGR